MFSIWNFTIKLFHLLDIQLVFGTSAAVTRRNLFFGCFLDGSRVFKESAGIACHAFKTFSRGWILLELEISFLPIIFKLFFKLPGFAHPLRIFSRFYLHFNKSGNNEQWHFTVA